MTAGEWILGSPKRARPFFDDPIEVWLEDGSTRRAQLKRENAPFYTLLDCTHPMQNILLNGDRIVAWRIAE